MLSMLWSKAKRTVADALGAAQGLEPCFYCRDGLANVFARSFARSAHRQSHSGYSPATRP